MTVHRNNLPWARGDTYGGIGGAAGITLANESLGHLMGATFVVPDTEHGTGADVVLRIVRNDTGAAITFANQIMRFGLSAQDFGRTVDGTTNQVGMIGLPIDDAFASGASIPAGDFFYVIQQGPCNIAMNASSVALVAHEPVTPDTAGACWGTLADAYKFQLGTIDQDCSTTTTAALVWVDAQLVNPSGSGT